jgi:hypothetical protein
MDVALRDRILDLLYEHEQAVTYGALAGVIGCNPRSVMRGSSGKHRCSWVVNSGTRRPTGFRPVDLHPSLAASVEEKGVIRTADELRNWLSLTGSGPFSARV